MAFTPIIIAASYERPDNSPAQGTITATLSESISNGAASIDPTPIVGVLDHNGDLVNDQGAAFALIANNDPSTLPQGSFYLFTIQLDSAPARAFHAVVPYNAVAGTVTLIALEDAKL